MNNTKSAKIALYTALVFCMTALAGIPAFADNNSALDPEAEAPVKISAEKHKNYLEDAVLKLVEEGKLTKEKAEKILEYKKKRADELGKLNKEQKLKHKKQLKKGSLLNELKENGIISDKEAQDIKAKLHEMKEARLNDRLQDLVERGVLTSADIDKMRGYILKIREEKKERIEKLKSMTPEERKAYFKENKEFRKDILSRMVEDKVITPKQAEEIRKAIPELGKSRFREFKDIHRLH